MGAYILKWLVVAPAVGVTGGLAAALLRTVVEIVSTGTGSIPLWIAPAVGGVLVSLLSYIDPLVTGFGMDRYIRAVNRRDGYISAWRALTKFAATVATVGFRGSGGLTGPLAVIGGAVSNALDKLPLVRRLLSEYDRRVLTACGAAGAIGAVFHAPLAGGILAVEVLYRSSLHYADLFPAMLASTMGFVAYGLFIDTAPLLIIPGYVVNVTVVGYFLLAGVLSGFISNSFNWVFFRVQHAFRHLPFVRFRPAVGGLLAGLVLVAVPDASGVGFGFMQSLVMIPRPLAYLLLLCTVKIIATSLTIGSGGSGGLVIPALIIGAISGNIVAGVVAGGDLSLAASIAVSGMSASLASIANVPIAAAILLIEMTGLQLGVPATVGTVIGFMIGRRHVIYETTTEDDFESERPPEITGDDLTKDDRVGRS